MQSKSGEALTIHSPPPPPPFPLSPPPSSASPPLLPRSPLLPSPLLSPMSLVFLLFLSLLLYLSFFLTHSPFSLRPFFPYSLISLRVPLPPLLLLLPPFSPPPLPRLDLPFHTLFSPSSSFHTLSHGLSPPSFCLYFPFFFSSDPSTLCLVLQSFILRQLLYFPLFS